MKDDKLTTHDSRWFKNPMVWMVILLPASVVIASMITIVIAVKTDDGVVVDNYYKEGLEINKDIRADRKAKELQVSAFIDLDTRTGELRISLSASSTMAPPAELTFRLIHRTRSGLDQVTVLSRAADSEEYRGYIKPPIIAGRWTVEVSAENYWRVRQNLTTKSAGNVLMNITS